MTTAFGRAKILLSEAIKEDHAGNAEEAFKWYKQVCNIYIIFFLPGIIYLWLQFLYLHLQGCTELLDAIKETNDPKQQAGYSKALKNYLLRAEQVKLNEYNPHSIVYTNIPPTVPRWRSWALRRRKLQHHIALGKIYLAPMFT